MRLFSSVSFPKFRSITWVILTLLMIVVSGPVDPLAARGNGGETDAPDSTSSDGTTTTAAQGGSGTRVDASQGGVTIQSGVNSLTIGARMQLRWTLDDLEALDEDTAGSSMGVEDGVTTGFDVPRMRLTLRGRAFRPWMLYQFQFEFGGTSGEDSSKIKDAILEIAPPGRNFSILAGQYKAPFGLQQLTSSGRQQFVDRAITDSKFSPGRDMGVMLSGTAVEEKVGYEGGVFNGSGESNTQQNEALLYVGRVYFQPFGSYDLAEGGNDTPDRPVVHVGFGARSGEPIRGRASEEIVQDVDNQTAYDIELGFKAPRTFATAEFFWMTDEQENPRVRRDIDSWGYHAQVGYMVVPTILEVGFRVAEVDGDTEVDESSVRELRGVVGYYWLGHSLKLQVDFGQVRYDAGYDTLSPRALSGLPSLDNRLVSGQSLSDAQVRAQLQVAF